MEVKAQQLLEAVERIEQAAKRGIAINQNRDPSIPAEKTISVEQCEWTLKDCRLFRSAICRTFELPQQDETVKTPLLYVGEKLSLGK